MDFDKLRKKRGSGLRDTAKKLEEMNSSGGFQRDERLYKPGFDKEKGLGYARLRLIPAKEGENFVRQFSHGFKGKGDGYYYETSLTTIGEKDPVSISNALYWKAGEESDSDKEKNRLQNVSRRRRRRTKYFVNVYVERDDVNKEAEGTVKILECGPQIWEVVERAIKPKFDDQKAIDPFDLWEGAPIIVRVEGKEIPDRRTSNMVTVPNYEESGLGDVGAFMDNDESKMQEVFNQTHDLSEFMKVKSFKELADRFEKVEGEPYNRLDPEAGPELEQKANEKVEKERTMAQEQSPPPAMEEAKSESAPKDEDTPPHFESSEEEEEESSDSDEDDALKKFQQLLGRK